MKTKLTILILFAIFGVLSVNAATFIETWSDTNDEEGWTTMDLPTKGAGYGTVDWQPSISGKSGALQITGGAASAMPKRDIIYGDSEGVAGSSNFKGGQYAKFDFYAQDNPPQQLDVFFKSTAGSGERWYRTITGVVAGWNSFLVVLSPGNGWYGGSDFLTDVQSVDEVGIAIWYRNNEAGQVYALENFGVVPEPAAYLLLAVALLCLRYTTKKNPELQFATIRAS